MIEEDNTILADIDTAQHEAIAHDLLRSHPTLVMLAHPHCCLICGYRCDEAAQLEQRRKSCGCFVKDYVIDEPYGLNKDTGEIEKMSNIERLNH